MWFIESTEDIIAMITCIKKKKHLLIPILFLALYWISDKQKSRGKKLVYTLKDVRATREIRKWTNN